VALHSRASGNPVRCRAAQRALPAYSYASIIWRCALRMVGLMIGQVQRWLIGLRGRRPSPGEAGRPAFDQPLDAGRTRDAVVVDIEVSLVGRPPECLVQPPSRNLLRANLLISISRL
jgi:hypothetical protein